MSRLHLPDRLLQAFAAAENNHLVIIKANGQRRGRGLAPDLDRSLVDGRS
jgi:hypothetical protein